MDEREQLATALRKEIERLKSILSITTEERQRHEVHRQINTCICESLALLAPGLKTHRAAQATQQGTERARHVGQH